MVGMVDGSRDGGWRLTEHSGWLYTDYIMGWLMGVGLVGWRLTDYSMGWLMGVGMVVGAWLNIVVGSGLRGNMVGWEVGRLVGTEVGAGTGTEDGLRVSEKETTLSTASSSNWYIGHHSALIDVTIEATTLKVVVHVPANKLRRVVHEYFANGTPVASLISFFRLVLSLSVGAELAAKVKGNIDSSRVCAWRWESRWRCWCGDEVLELKCLVVGLAHDLVSH